MKKIIKIIGIIALIVILNFAILLNTVKAVNGEQIHVYSTGYLSRMLKYNGMLIKTAHAVYEKNGEQYPAYCLNVELQGAGEIEYDVTEEGKITDIGLWRVIINGYPYKNLEELGVVSIDEAYTATKQAIYCYLYNRSTATYSGVGESGERTVNAMNKILTSAQNSTAIIEEANTEIIGKENWKIDEKEKEYISKQYEVKNNIAMLQYKIKLEEQLDGTRVTDVENNEKNEFNQNEKFKILIPIKKLKESGTFKIKLETQMETRPILYGKAPNEYVQNYALTAYSYETVDTEITQNYKKNETKIRVIKKDEETNKLLKGATFELLDENKKIIKTLKTNEKGEIDFEEILPGKYYVKEKQAPKGYETNPEEQEININLNEKINVIFKNSKVIVEVPQPEKQIEVKLKRLPVTGM